MQTAQTSFFLASVISEFLLSFDLVKNNGFYSFHHYFISLYRHNASFDHYKKKSNRSSFQVKMEHGTVLCETHLADYLCNKEMCYTPVLPNNKDVTPIH